MQRNVDKFLHAAAAQVNFPSSYMKPGKILKYVIMRRQAMSWIKMDSFKKVAAVHVKAKLAEMHKACPQAESIWL